MTEKIYPVVVIGGGAAGTMATLRCVLNNDETLFFSGSAHNKKLSRTAWLDKIDKLPGHNRFQGDHRAPYGETLQFIKEGGYSLKLNHVENVDVTELRQREDGIFQIIDDQQQKYLAEYAIVCTGVEFRLPLVKGNSVDIFSCENVVASELGDYVESLPLNDKNVVIFGACEQSLESAIVIHERHRPQGITVLTNGTKIKPSSDIQKLIVKYGIDINEEKIDEMIINDQKLVTINLENSSNICGDIYYLLLGYDVHNELLKNMNINYDQKGFVKADAKGETNINKLYVSGDIQCGIKKQVFTAYDHAVDSADDINAKIRLSKRNKKLEDFRNAKK